MGFKPCYKWNTFNTRYRSGLLWWSSVLNLVISGIPSIQLSFNIVIFWYTGFKPCYKWNTFNTDEEIRQATVKVLVLNLVISGIPSILKYLTLGQKKMHVLNLVISGIPSILPFSKVKLYSFFWCFKPCYKWNTFNT